MEKKRPRCANCGVDIPWRPAVYQGQTYCCGGCAQGGPCYCSYDLAAIESRRPTSMELELREVSQRALRMVHESWS